MAALLSSVHRITQNKVLRELTIFLVFCLLTALLTWPYVTRLRDAVAGPGDPYFVVWILWWDYHQTFTDPLNLFHANIFYPYRFTLAFSEHCYGLALPFFPLFALGLRPLTVHAVAMFFGFALSGYGAFRLARTLTDSSGVAWVAGILFAFVPYRFGLMAQLVYLFSVWIPLSFEAVILFVRERSWRRTIWLGFAVFMTGLSSTTWLLFLIIPMAAFVAVLLTRYGLWREERFWKRAGVAIGGAFLALLPFTIPFYIVSKMYGFKRSVDDVKAHSASPLHWFVAEGRNKLWRGMGSHITEAWKAPLFPGLLAVLLPLFELLRGESAPQAEAGLRSKWAKRLDVLALLALALSIMAIGFEGSKEFGGFFKVVRSEHALTLLCIALIARLCLEYPRLLRGLGRLGLTETIQMGRTDAFWCGVLLTVIGFLYSIGWNSFFYRILFNAMPGFRSIRAPVRGAMFTYLGLALLAGLGTKRLYEALSRRYSGVRSSVVYGLISLLLLAELNAVPLHFIRGDVFPDSVTIRLKHTPMRGGIAYLPANVDVNQRYMLRAADHGKPLIVGTSGFIPPYADQIEKLTASGAIPDSVMDVLETVPASYLVIRNDLVVAERKADYALFLTRALTAGRLRFIDRFDGRDDLYAVTKTEPEAKSDASLSK